MKRIAMHAVIAAMVVASCGTPGGQTLSASSPSAEPTASPIAPPTPTTSADSSDAARVLRPAPGFPGVETRSIGAVHGENAFVTRDAGLGSSSGAFAELWVVPLSNGAEARALVRYSGYTTPWLSSRLSPDGSRYAFELDRGDGVRRIAVANLADGSVRWLLSDSTMTTGTQPVWSPMGDRIAFASDAGSTSAALWVVNVDGSGMRRLISLADASPVYVHQWTPDGRSIAFYQGVGYDTVDVSTGSRVHMNGVVSADASWRLASPHLVAHGYVGVSGGDEQMIFLADDAAGTRNVLARGTSVSEFLGQPRWRPNVDEFIYGFSDYRTERAEWRVRSLSGAERILTVSGGSPTWTSDGAAIVYMHGEEVQLSATGEGQRALVLAEIRVIEADGTRDRLLYRTAATDGQLPPNWCVCNDAIATRRL